MTERPPLVFSLAPAALAQHVEFRPFRPGIEIARLYEEDGGSSAAFLRYAPGASLPPHRHAGYEHILVLEGAQHDDRGRYEAGTLVVNRPDTTHRVWSPDGCTVFVVWQRPVLFLAETSADSSAKEPGDT